MNKCEPWDLMWIAKMGDKEWYFFCVRDGKYQTGLRTNRATEGGYWKATGKDMQIYRGKSYVGMRKTLVFYKGRAPKGEKTSWVMHEFRLEGKLPEAEKNEWVICKVYMKSSDEKNTTGLVRMSSPFGDELGSALLLLADPVHVPCFSYGDELGSSLLPDCFSGASLAKQSCTTEREMVSFLHETGLTSNMNPEISSVILNHEMGMPPFIGQEDPSTSNAALQLDELLWRC